VDTPAFLQQAGMGSPSGLAREGYNLKDYRISQDHYPLCVRHPGYRRWWTGFVGELLERYPDLDGVDIGEPVVSWHEDGGCYCMPVVRPSRKKPAATVDTEIRKRLRL